ncbi:sensor histidine kinase [Clostridium botulinum]|uniref:histidine kinase n=1 Tax=Clostridium botulinum C/D str. DC5 TaxID=1443128 RepID=A0A0A0ILK1_CLOBO|nr:sensor histidine kinase [Clostridium botulinum]MCD3233582.1 sensor histidine kinase [Clostridium botulinum D/C]KGN00441.1 histidine kinase [Clostridium botulinum C/D str. DC5]MCD3239332.1 sensor histidine kinase [Clostridium botulinum D/C]MCD3267004.1 sensor histidine kinase [Clostridium botulinum D/C]MCD3298871.1 sensor histidine kinase [Clostridium botulinum D/C]
MEYIFKLFFYSFVISTSIIEKNVTCLCVASFLLIVIVDILVTKYIKYKYFIYLQSIIIVVISYYNPIYIVFLSMCSYELIKRENYFGILFFVPMFKILDVRDLPINILFFLVVNLYGYIYNKYIRERKKYKTLYDNERRIRYELEGTKNRLIHYAAQVEHLTEIKERNRIAREIHDTVGHSIAGLYMQLQASAKIRDKNKEKSDELVDKSIDELSNILSLLKDTVYNIKPVETVGIEYIVKIVDNFKYCKVNFKNIGNFNNISSNIMEIIATNIKESLTNVSKYSMANKVDINLDANENYIRLYIKDDGVGCKNIKEGLGISGMKERIRNIGGSISIDSINGFLIVCVIPIKDFRGEIFENYNS